jgi:hypothetical protein
VAPYARFDPHSSGIVIENLSRVNPRFECCGGAKALAGGYLDVCSPRKHQLADSLCL